MRSLSTLDISGEQSDMVHSISQKYEYGGGSKYESRKLKNIKTMALLPHSGNLHRVYQNDLCPSCHTTSACLLLLCLLTAHPVMKHDIVQRTVWNEKVTSCDRYYFKTPIIQLTDNISISSEDWNECLPLLYENVCLQIWVKMSFQVNGPISCYFEWKWDPFTFRIIFYHNVYHSVLFYGVSSEG